MWENRGARSGGGVHVLVARPAVDHGAQPAVTVAEQSPRAPGRRTRPRRLRVHALPSQTERLWFSHILEAPPPARHSASRLAPTGCSPRARPSTSSPDKFPNLKRYGLGGRRVHDHRPRHPLRRPAAQGPSLPSPAPPSAADLPHLQPACSTSSSACPTAALNCLTGLLEYPPAALFHKSRAGRVPLELGAAGDRRQPPRSVRAARLTPRTLTATVCSRASRTRGCHAIRSRCCQTRAPRGDRARRARKTRAKQYSSSRRPGDCMLGDRAMCVHSTATRASTGQGVVMESLGLSACLLLSWSIARPTVFCAGNLPHSPLAAACTIVVKYVPLTRSLSITSDLINSNKSVLSLSGGDISFFLALRLPALGTHPASMRALVLVLLRYRQDDQRAGAPRERGDYPEGACSPSRPSPA